MSDDMDIEARSAEQASAIRRSWIAWALGDVNAAVKGSNGGSFALPVAALLLGC